jgi:hypothetical protein
LNLAAHAIDQIPEPAKRLGDQTMTPSRHQQQAVKFAYKLLGAPRFIRKAFLFCPSDLSLKGILVHLSKNQTQAWAEFKLVKPVGATRVEILARITNLRQRPKLHISLPLATTLFSQPVHEFFEIIEVIEKGFTMIGERE